jgi:hypothetical protein
MQPHRLTEQMLDPGQRLAHYFNGRLLSAEDLGLERTATRLTLRRLGQALGEGVATGLEVSVASQQPAVVRVAPGFALARDGTALEIPTEAGPVEVELALPAAVAPARSGDGKFGNCTPLTSPGFTGQDGFYLLTISPTQGPEGLARVMGLPGETVRCTTRYEVPGVVFDLIQLNVTGLAAGDPRTQSLLAARCFGLPPVTLRGNGTSRTDALLDSLRPHLLPACSAPLAVVQLTTTGLKFLDLWAARRRLAGVSDLARWSPLLGARRAAELEAMSLQFAAQLESRLAQPGTDATKLAAQQDFAWLPSAGLLPAPLDWKVFLGPHAPRAATALRAALVRAQFLEALAREPIPVADFAAGRARSDTPPVPVEVYAPEPAADFVLFVRSGLGRVRVFGEPADEFKTAGEEFTGSLRGARGWRLGELSSSAAQLQFDAVPADAGTLALAADGYRQPAEIGVGVVAGQTTDVPVTFEPLPRGALLVTVRDPEGQPAGARVSRVTATRDGGGSTDGLRLGDGSWQVAELEDGQYSLRVVAAGFREAMASGLEVKRGFTTQVLVDLLAVPRSDPPACFRVHWQVRERLAARVCLLPKLIHLPRLVLDWPVEYVATSKVQWPAYDYRRIQSDDTLVELEIETAAFQARGTEETVADSAAANPQFLRLSKRKFGVAELQQRLKLKPAEPPPWRNFTPLNLRELARNAAAVEQWLGQWRDTLAADHPGYGLERAIPAIWFGAEPANFAVRRVAPAKAEAWAVFGSVGVPLVVTPENEILPLPVRPEEVLPARPWFFYDRLKDLGIQYADQVPHLWTELFDAIQFTDPAPEFASDILHDAREAVTKIQADRLYFPGVKADDMARLRDTPFGTDVGLANAAVAGVAAVLGGNAALARQLISNARLAVNPDSWSLRGLAGLGAGELTGLRAQGVNSLGQLAAFAQTPAGQAAFTALGVGGTQVSQWVAGAEATITAGVRGEFLRTGFTKIAGDAATAEVLGRSGFSAESLAGAKPAEVAARTGLSEAQSADIISKAQQAGAQDAVIGAAMPTLSDTERRALETAGVRTVGDMNKLPATRLKELLGGSAGRATLLRNNFGLR